MFGKWKCKGLALFILVICMLLALPALAEARFPLQDGYDLVYEVEEDHVIIKGFPMEQQGTFKGKLVIPETVEGLPVTIIEDLKYEGNITEIVLPPSVTHIADSAFSGCTSLKKITLPEGLLEIGNEAFYSTALTKLTIPESVLKVGNGILSYCFTIKEMTVKGYDTKFQSGNLFFPVNLETVYCWSGSGVDRALQKNPFVKLKYLKVEKKSETVEAQTILAEGLYEDRRDITHLVIPEGVVEIGNETFRGMANLKELKLPSSLKKIGDYAFEGCASLTQVKLPDGLESMGRYAFSRCLSLKSIELPGSLTTIGSDTFYMCAKLKTIKVKKGITELPGNFAFGCGELSKVELPSTLESIGRAAFSECSSLAKITLPKGLKKMGVEIFANNGSLKSIEIPKGVTEIPDGAFKMCLSLSKVKIPEGVTRIGGTAFMYTGIKSIQLPKGIVQIGDRAFFGCTGLSKTNVPESVEKIGSDVFVGANKKKPVTVSCVKGSYADQYFQRVNDNVKLKYVKK
ncbi:MAG: leucine-rich repeat domain-containing protein [Clostridia bacterium]|nr:leucine-rich repeat domain-containing protein [Clostridia bacterium]